MVFDNTHKPKSSEVLLLLLPLHYFIKKLSQFFVEQQKNSKMIVRTVKQQNKACSPRNSQASCGFEMPIRFWFLYKSQLCRNFNGDENDNQGCKFGWKCWFVFLNIYMYELKLFVYIILKTIIYIYVFLNFKGMHMGRIN
jgi:hypothetical protein